ncbi:MAG: alpha/beta fold hydrolase [Gemmatimonadota bacterium]
MPLSIRQSAPAHEAGRGTVVFIHGFPFNGGMWAPQLRALPDGWRGLAPDLRGFGRTGVRSVPGPVPTGRRVGGRIARPNEPVLTMACLAADVAALIEQEVDGPAVVCGLSMGGYVAFELWRRHPDRVRALVLADTRAEADDDEGRENRLRAAHAARESGTRPLAAAMIPTLLAETTRKGMPEVVEQVRTMIVETVPGTIIAALAGMAARHDSTGELGGITVPTLVIAGEHDALTNPDGARAMADAIPDATFVEIPTAGHISNLENPAAFNGALAEFLDRLEPE